MDTHQGDGSPSTDLVVVPWAPGAPIRLEHSRNRDEVDELLDDVFGPDDDDGGPGWFDLLLLVGGVAAGVAVLTGVLGDGWLWVAVPALLLGSVLPLRTAWRAVQRRRADRARSHKLGRGLPIDAADPDVAGLLAAYDSLQVAAAEAGLAPIDESATAAAHTALLEAASLLRGAPPVGPAEREYVRRRAQAIEELVGVLESRRSLIATEEANAAEAAKELDRTARFEALTELDDRLGPDSIEQMAFLRQAIEGDQR